MTSYIGLFQKKSKQGEGRGDLRIYFSLFIFYFSYPWKFQTKQLSPWIFHKIVLDPLAQKFQGQKHRPLEIPHAISLIPLEIPYPQPPYLDFFWNSPFGCSGCFILIKMFYKTTICPRRLLVVVPRVVAFIQV